MSNEKRHQSGSPASWKLRRTQYRQHRVSNPGTPSPTNRQARREKLQESLDPRTPEYGVGGSNE